MDLNGDCSPNGRDWLKVPPGFSISIQIMNMHIISETPSDLVITQPMEKL